MPAQHSNQWTHDDEHPGSLFHKLVVLPTLAPHLACPEYLDSTRGPIVLPQPRSQQMEDGVMVARQLPPGSLIPDNVADLPPSTPSTVSTIEVEAQSNGSDDVDPPREFFLNVILERTEVTYNTRGPGKPKVVSESKLGPKLPVLELSHESMIESMLEVHGHQESGGAQGAPIIRQDDDWSSLKGQLAVMKVAVDSIQVTLSMKELEPYKSHKRPLSPDPVEESVSGTYVPSIHAYSSTQCELGTKIATIKAAWPCLKHSHCYIDVDGQHIMLNHFKLNSWGTALLTDHFDVVNGPPEDLLAEWKGIKTPCQPPLPKVCGMNGPRSASGLVAGGLNNLLDIGTILTACATPFLKSLATTAMATLAPTSFSAGNPAHNTECLLSPPPAIKDELAACTKAFGAARGIVADTVDKAVDGLDKVCYTPDIMGEVNFEHLKALTALPEGHAIALRKFAHEWCGKIDTKHARCM